MTTDKDTAPLTFEDFDAQDAELDALREHDDEVPQWEFCEGFMAALICARRAIAPEEYWPVLLGEEFKPMQHMEFVWRWRRRWAEVAAQLDAPVETLQDEAAYQPEVLDTRGAVMALPAEERGDTDMATLPAYAQVWALGFMYAVENWPQDWTPPRDNDSAKILDESLELIVALTEDDTGKPLISMYSEDDPPSVSEARIEHMHEAIWAVYDLRLLWKSLGPRIDPIRKEAEPGRNDPCPCGSGKKYKKCHGAG
ncbi:MAG: UPF0149 family protein [Ramlibacter sp.]|nr:UPF0149 family protein [Ramlibacter sp.]